MEDILDYEFSLAEKIVGFESLWGKNAIRNHLAILLKYYVHICRIFKKKPFVGVLVSRIKYNEKIENTIAQKKQLEMKHMMKWEEVLENISDMEEQI